MGASSPKGAQAAASLTMDGDLPLLGGTRNQLQR
jgi:hypothetical protein